MAERDEPGRPSDDLFEDLDKFFSSIDEEDWPEPIGSGRGPRQGSPGEGGEPPATPPAEAEAPPPPAPAPRPSPPETQPRDAEEEIGPRSGFWETGGRRDAGQEEEPAEPKAGGELTLDDLRKAPPQYRDLPGPDDEGEPAGGFEPPAAPQRTGTGSSSFASD